MAKKKSAKPRSIRDLCEALSAKPYSSRQGYVTHIRFPAFKNLVAGARIDFTFPLTALIGPNGSGKTSVLHALYGAPLGKSTSDFWFATACDPIKEGGGEVTRFIYGHVLDGQGVVETRKARVSKKDRPDYWEPTKATASDGMVFDNSAPAGKGRATDRWYPVARDVLYLNFRSEISAFDKFMFFGESGKGKRANSKQHAIRRRSTHLKKVIDGGHTSFKLFHTERVFENRLLTNAELASVSQILGRNYESARLVSHSLFGNVRGLSVRFELPGLRYTEAFAGSGELAVASLVAKVTSAKDGTLVVLDEPEVSLHPGAQRKLLEFLLRSALEHDHQIIFSTHSPFLVEELPDSAIKAFYRTSSGKFGIEQRTHPYAAFKTLGALPPDRLTVLVEDRLGEKVVRTAMQRLNEAERSLFEVTVLPGGANAYLAHRIPTLMIEKPHNSLVLLDGDKKTSKFDTARDPDTFAKSEEDRLEDHIKEVVDCVPSLLTDGSGGESNADQKVSLQKMYLNYVRNRVRFLPRNCPEEIFIVALLDPNYVATTSKNAKETFRKHFLEISDDLSQQEMEGYAHVRLAEQASNNPDLAAIEAILREALRTLASPKQSNP